MQNMGERIQYENEIHEQVLKAVFPYLYPAKSKGVTFKQFSGWLEDNGFQDARLIWDKEPNRMLVQVEDFEGKHRTYVMSTLLRMIERKQ